MPDTGNGKVTELAKFGTPYGREILLQDVTHESGMNLLRLRIREGSRFTILDVDAGTAAMLGKSMIDWSKLAMQLKNLGSDID